MAGDVRPLPSARPPLPPDEVAQRSFSTVWRGFDPTEVRDFLNRLAQDLRDVEEREAALREQLIEALARAAEPPVLDEETLTEALGEETTRILRDAREAAHNIKEKAELTAQQLLTQAEEDAARMREEAGLLLNARTEETEQFKSAAQREIDEQRDALIAAAQAEADKMLEDSRSSGRHLVQEAQSLRMRMLEDLSRRGKIAHAQIEQLRAGRDHLLESFQSIRLSLDQVTEELHRAEADAREAAEAAGKRAADEAALTIEELEAMLPSAGDAGPDVGDAGPVPQGPSHSVSPEGATDGPLPTGHPHPDETGQPQLEVAEALIEAPTDEPAAAAVDEPVAAESEGLLQQEEEAEERAPLRVFRQEVPLPEPVEPQSPEEEVRIIGRAPESDEEVVAASETNGRGKKTRARRGVFGRTREDEAPEESLIDLGAEAASVEAPDDTELLQRRDMALKTIQAGLVRRLKRALQDEQNEVLEKLRNGDPVSTKLLSGVDAQSRKLRDATSKLIDQAARAGADQAGATNASDAAANAGTEIAEELAIAIAEPLSEQLASVITAAAKGGGDTQKTAIDKVGATYREWKRQRIEALAGDYAAAAFSRGVYMATSEGESLRWILERGGSPCTNCARNAGDGELVRGRAFSGGQLYPPAHPGCRCLLAAPSRVAASA